MSNQRCFFHSISTLYTHGCTEALDYCLAETDALIAQIRYHQQVHAPFWYCLLDADGVVVSLCRNLAGHLGCAVPEVIGQRLDGFLVPAVQKEVRGLMRQARWQGLATTILPGRHGVRLGIVAVPFPWPELGLGSFVGLVRPLKDDVARFRFAFHRLDRLRVVMALDPGGVIRGIDPLLAGRLRGTVDSLIGSCLFCHLSPENAQVRQSSFLQTVWTGQPVEWQDVGESGVAYDFVKLPVLDAGDRVVQVLLLAREQQRVFVQAGMAEPERVRMIA